MENPNANRDNRRYTLEELGITSSLDIYGDEHLTISLPPNSLFGTGEGQAVLNSSTRKWELSVTGHTRFSQKIDASFKRKDSVAGQTEVLSRPVKWTEVLPKTEHVDKFLNDIDWDATSLGPLETWPNSLQAYLNIVFADSQAAVIYWGDDLLTLYNAEFIQLVTDRLTKSHQLLGMPFTKVWPELWADFEPMLQKIAAQGTGLDTLEVTLYPLRDGVPEETIWQGSFLPIRDDAGIVRGFYNRAREITRPLVAERRAKVLSTLSAKPHLTGADVFQHLINSLAVSERDFPLSFVYSAHETLLTEKCRLQLECGAGLPEQGHPLVPVELQLYEGNTGFVPHFRRAMSSDKVLVLRTQDGTLPPELVSGFHWRGFGEQANSLAILPLSTSDRLIALLVVGLNPRRPYDVEHEGYLNTLLRSMSAMVSSALDREEARNRADRLAKQLAHSEKSIREIAEYGPVGIARFSPGGKLMWGNDQYYEITGHGRNSEDHYEKSFYDIVIEDDLGACSKAWEELCQHKAISITLRVKKTWRPPKSLDAIEDEEEQNVYVLAAGYPMMEGLELEAYAISVVDVSRFKWAEQVQSKVAASAKEAKRLQENFIDIVSHEMRNPLSAIAQLADAISGSVDDFGLTSKGVADAIQILENNVDNATTIQLCAEHQKRIIDDVLTLSKLDSMLLSITPIVVQPHRIIEDALRMFEAEFIAHDIEVQQVQTQAYKDLKLDWVSLDPSRLTQIFINLITNAIKFTKLERERRITICIGASDFRPPSLAKVNWFPTNKKYKDLTKGPEWGEGKPVYVCFEVQDTGRGLEQDEMTKLFGRFQQATEKTHLKYGGSGLGLFISRELTETQGGEIGVVSARGKGTTFAFYVKGRRAEPPKDPARGMLRPDKSSKTPRGRIREADQQEDAQSSDESNVNDRLTILLCEDNIVNSRVMKQQLQKQGCEVYVANHGMEALDLLGRSSAWKGMQEQTEAVDFDIILMDVEMPIMDGITCTRRIRQLEGEGKLTRHMHVIAITANARKEQLDTVIQAGCDDVLPKPFRIKDCLRKIRQNLEQDKLRKAGEKLQAGAIA